MNDISRAAFVLVHLPKNLFVSLTFAEKTLLTTREKRHVQLGAAMC